MTAYTCGYCNGPITKDYPAFISQGGITVAYHHEGDDPTCYMKAQWEWSGIHRDESVFMNLVMQEDDA